MKKLPIFLLAIAALLAAYAFQTKPVQLNFNDNEYTAAWRAIDSLEQRGLPKSALDAVGELVERAKTDRNDPQIVKGLLYRSKYVSQLNEDGTKLAIEQLEQEIAQAAEPVKSVLQSALGSVYQQYLDNSRWRIQERTQVAGADEGDDMLAWSVERLQREADQYYLASVKAAELKKTPTGKFGAVLDNDSGEPVELRPTLYDVLVHRAVEHFKNERNYLTEPTNRFVLTAPRAFDPAESYARFDWAKEHPESGKARVLELYKEWLRFRMSDQNDLAFLDVELARLNYVYDQSALTDKRDRYLEALNRLLKEYEGNTEAALVIYYIAQNYVAWGNDYNADIHDEERKMAYATAIQYCELAKEKYPGSYGTQLCEGIHHNLLNKNLALQLESVVLPGQPMPIRFDYQNVNRAYVRVIRLDERRRQQMEKLQNSRNGNSREKILDYLAELPSVYARTVDLTLPEDYRSHSLEVTLPAQPLGDYLMLSSSSPEFTYKGAATGYTGFDVSEIGYRQRTRDLNDSERALPYRSQNATEFLVYHRETGKPLNDVRVEVYENRYNSLSRTSSEHKIDEKRTNKNGWVVVDKISKERSLFVRFFRGKDSLTTAASFRNYQSDNRNYSNTNTHFFLDRAIYRPGQTVYYKGLVLSSETGENPTIRKNYKTTVTFRDANYQEVAKQEVSTNEYGTFTGSFVAPQGGLLGSMQLQEQNGMVSFRVEEYKRPKFEVVIDPVEETYRPKDTVSVTGTARAYAGNNLDGATVAYRVTRSVNYPWMPWWRRSYYPVGQEQVVAFGELATDADGTFTIKFPAQPDESIAKSNNPLYRYEVSVDVVDITGETQSGSSTVRVGEKTLLLSTEISDRIHRDSLKAITISAQNLNGQDVPVTGTLRLKRLEVPDRIFKDRLWEPAEFNELDRGEWRRMHPHLAFRNEDEPRNWTVGKTVVDKNFSTKDSKKVDLQRTKPEPGVYRLELAAKDRFGNDISYEKIVTVYDTERTEAPYPTIALHIPGRTTYEPGETASWHLISSLRDLPVYVEVERDGRLLRKEWTTVNKLHTFTQSVTEADRGGFAYRMMYAQYNRSFTETQRIAVPWTNKELSIEYGSFRDKLKPGEKETWSFVLKGPKGEAVAAEMVAAMYDASLDAFAANNWNLSLYRSNYPRLDWGGPRQGTSGVYFHNKNWRPPYPRQDRGRSYPQLNLFGFSGYDNYPVVVAGYSTRNRRSDVMIEEAEMMMDSAPAAAAPPPPPSAKMEEAAVSTQSADAGADEMRESDGTNKSPAPTVRENLNETVFFLPQLRTDKEGNIRFEFTMNEALTRWKFMGLAHTEDLKIGQTEREIVTQKELMVQPNAPRFFRERDEIEFTAKVVNLSEEALSGSADIALVNPISGKPIFAESAAPKVQSFSVEPGRSALVAFRFKVPPVSEVPLIEHTIAARAGNFSDAERSVVPVVTNRMLVTETKPLPIAGNQTENFTLDRWLDNNSTTLQTEAVTLEFTSNPAWYAVQSLPYLMEYPYECTEQIFSRFYANSIATSVANSHPRVKQVFDSWRQQTPDALESNLSKNEELKSALLAETPWVLQAQSEAQQKKNIGLLFDLNRMSYEQKQAVAKLQERQMVGGGWAWFPGGRDNWYITQYIVAGLGHLDKLGVQDVRQDASTWNMTEQAVRYIDARATEAYTDLMQQAAENDEFDLDKNHLSPMLVHYLYARSFFLEDKSAQAGTGGVKPDRSKYIAFDGAAQTAFDYFKGQAEKYWTARNLYNQGMIALALHRTGGSATPRQITASLTERALTHPELGTYWKYPQGWYWYQHPIETHSLLIETFDEVAADAKMVEQLKIWLLKQKQTTHWKTTKATAEAVYALLRTGDNWLLENEPVQISFVDKKVNRLIEEKQQNAEAGTGYFKIRFDGENISKDLAKIEVRNPNKSIAWGALYWQYFEDLDKIDHFAETPLKLEKQLYKVLSTSTGEQLEAVGPNDKLEPGDKLKVRIELRTDRDMEYVHLKDMRAAGFEPIQVLSQYKWQDGLGYYESPGDLATNFFISYLPKGTYVFEYPLRVQLRGDFSNGVTTVQCMYAPEFTSFSEGIRVAVE